jgi:hypothetical protein
MIEHAQKPAAGTVASIIGVITLLFVQSKGLRAIVELDARSKRRTFFLKMRQLVR